VTLTPIEQTETAELRAYKRDVMKLLSALIVQHGTRNPDGTHTAAVSDRALAAIDAQHGWLGFERDRAAPDWKLTYHSRVGRRNMPERPDGPVYARSSATPEPANTSLAKPTY
jgi:hypothetical protein